MRVFVIILLFCLLCSAPDGFGQNTEYVSSTLWSDLNDVDVLGDYAYCVFRNGMTIVDISDPSSPFTIGQVYCQGEGVDIEIAGDYAFVSDSYSGIVIIDISVPESPQIIGSCETEGYVRNVSVQGDYAYIAGEHAISVFDLSNIEDPVLIGNIDMWSPQDIIAEGDYAFVASQGFGLRVVDISDPELPREVGSYDPSGSCFALDLVDEYVYLADNDSGLTVIDVSDPESPVPIGTFGNHMQTYDVSVHGDYACMVGSYDSLAIMDVSDPTDPFLIASYHTGSGAEGIRISDSLAYIATNSGLQILDLSEPLEPLYVGFCPSAHRVYGVHADGDYLYTANAEDGLTIVDMSDPSNPIIIGSFPTPDAAIDVYVTGNYAYLTCYEPGLQIVDISDPENPIGVAVYDTTDLVYAVYATLAYAFVAYGHSGLQIVDVSDPYNPHRIGEYIPEYPRSIHNIHIQLNSVPPLAIASLTANGIEIIDLTDLSAPLLLSRFQTYGSARGAWIEGSYAYVATSYDDQVLEIIDIGNPYEPRRVSYLETWRGGYNIIVEGSYAYMASGLDGLTVIDIADPENPFVVDIYRSPGMAWDLTKNGEYISIADTYSSITLRPALTNISEIQNRSNQLSLIQNYPNPFNSSTSIRFSLPEPSDVAIEIYNILGQRVAVLFDGYQSSGSHSVNWNAADLSSGLYFARVSVGGRTENTKMVLSK